MLYIIANTKLVNTKHETDVPLLTVSNDVMVLSAEVMDCMLLVPAWTNWEGVHQASLSQSKPYSLPSETSGTMTGRNQNIHRTSSLFPWRICHPTANRAKNPDRSI